MKIEQITITKIIADEGKILKRKCDGHFYGTEMTLGYNYYEAGVALSSPKLETPDDFEEIDKPENYEERGLEINQAKRMKRMQELITEERQHFTERGLTTKESIEVKELAPRWGVEIKVGDTVTKGMRFTYEDKLWEVLQDHTVLSHYYPSINTASLYMEVTENYDEEGNELGTVENPIPYSGNMALENGKYYTQDGVTYRCTRDTGNPVYNALKDLVGIYVVQIN